MLVLVVAVAGVVVAAVVFADAVVVVVAVVVVKVEVVVFVVVVSQSSLKEYFTIRLCIRLINCKDRVVGPCQVHNRPRHYYSTMIKTPRDCHQVQTRTTRSNIPTIERNSRKSDKFIIQNWKNTNKPATNSLLMSSTF